MGPECATSRPFHPAFPASGAWTAEPVRWGVTFDKLIKQGGGNNQVKRMNF